MKILVVYKSRTGFTKKYAEIVAGKIACELMDFKRVTAEVMSDLDIVVYGSRLHAGFIDGIKKAREMFVKSGAKELVVFATGGTPNEAVGVIDEVWKNNLTAEEIEGMAHFYMQSGICYEKMSFPDKAIMKMAATMMSKKQDKSDYEAGFEQALKGSYDVSDEKYAQPLIKYLEGKN